MQAGAGKPLALERLKNLAVSNAFLGLVLSILSFRGILLTVGPGLDRSWQAAIHMLANPGLERTPDLVFTYGPLGFLAHPMLFYPATALLAVAFNFVAQLVFCYQLVRVLRRNSSIPVALAIAFVVVRAATVFVGIEVVITATAFIVCIDLLDRPRDMRERIWTIRLLGLAAGLQMLVKFNAGLTMVALLALIVLVSRDRRIAAESALLVSLTFIGGWLLTGGAISAIPGVVLNSVELVRGYSEAMGAETPSLKGDYLLGPGLLLVVAIFARSSTASWTKSRRITMWLLLSIWIFTAYKHAFVRHDTHQPGLFLSVMVAVCVFVSIRQEQQPLFIAVIALALFAMLQTGMSNFYDTVNPVSSLSHGTEAARLIVSPTFRDTYLKDSRGTMQRSYFFEPQTLEVLKEGSFHAYPSEASVAWAFPQLEWNPLPIYQAYSAYTSRLDRTNARALSGGGGPERILREVTSIDFRNPSWESPATMLSIICNFSELHAQARWQVLGRVDDRCGKIQHISTVTAERGVPVRVPAADGQLVLARLRGFKSQPLFALRTVAWKAPSIYVAVKGPESTVQFRLVPGTAEEGLIVSAPDLGYSNGFGFENYSTIELVPPEELSDAGTSRTYEIEFVKISLAEK